MALQLQCFLISGHSFNIGKIIEVIAYLAYKSDSIIMKGVLLCLLVFTLTMGSCLKDPGLVYRYEGTIKGENPFTRKCGGGYWIIINGYDYSHDSITTFDSLPAKSGLDLRNIQLPMSVRLNWHPRFGDTCGLIDIDDIEQIK